MTFIQGSFSSLSRYLLLTSNIGIVRSLGLTEVKAKIGCGVKRTLSEICSLAFCFLAGVELLKSQRNSHDDPIFEIFSQVSHIDGLLGCL
ncbi:putative fluoride ion transporter CrcB [Dirofilaria immitis]